MGEKLPSRWWKIHPHIKLIHYSGMRSIRSLLASSKSHQRGGEKKRHVHSFVWVSTYMSLISCLSLGMCILLVMIASFPLSASSPRQIVADRCGKEDGNAFRRFPVEGRRWKGQTEEMRRVGMRFIWKEKAVSDTWLPGLLESIYFPFHGSQERRRIIIDGDKKKGRKKEKKARSTEVHYPRRTLESRLKIIYLPDILLSCGPSRYSPLLEELMEMRDFPLLNRDPFRFLSIRIQLMYPIFSRIHRVPLKSNN